MKILVTGAAGFIGFKLVLELAARGDIIIGLDNINDYYDIRLKYGRLQECGIASNDIPHGKLINSETYPNYKFIRISLEDKDSIDKLFSEQKFDKVINLAAQAGVRYSITNPYSYLESNLHGFLNILEACRNNDVKHLVYASSSSVYGQSDKVPFSEEDKVDTPVSLYAATKKANELMAHSYTKLFKLPTSGLRFFTVYGPWGRPDMAPMLFADAISKGKPIDVFNQGNLSRDFTYIDDIVAGTIAVTDLAPNSHSNSTDYRIYNIGCSNPVNLMDFIVEIENNLGIDAIKNFLPMQQGDVYKTYADTSKLEAETNYVPKIGLQEGIKKFIDWYKSDKNPLN